MQPAKQRDALRVSPRREDRVLNSRVTYHGALISLLLSAGLLYLTKLGAFPLSNPNEGLYGELSREMMETGNYVTPQRIYAPYPEKPPLLAWLGAALCRVAGCTEFTARFWTATAGLAIAHFSRQDWPPLEVSTSRIHLPD